MTQCSSDLLLVTTGELGVRKGNVQYSALHRLYLLDVKHEAELPHQPIAVYLDRFLHLAQHQAARTSVGA